MPSSLANGPGIRCCLWLQGCSLGCPGCFNPETHDFAGGASYNIDDVFGWIREAPGVEGLTVSGGEPLQQVESLMELLELVRSKTDLSVLVFTGFPFEAAEQIPSFWKLKPLIDVLIAGPYVEGLAVRSSLISSTNKTLHFFSNRYSQADLATVPVSEVIISASGDVSVTGIDPVSLR